MCFKVLIFISALASSDPKNSVVLNKHMCVWEGGGRVFFFYFLQSVPDPTDMLTTLNSILQFLKPHISKSKTCLEILVKKILQMAP